MADYPLDSLGVQIQAHWKEHRPRMYRELEKAGTLTQAVYQAQERYRDGVADLVSNQGLPLFQAEEALREEAFLPSEDDEPTLPPSSSPFQRND